MCIKVTYLHSSGSSPRGKLDIEGLLIDDMAALDNWVWELLVAFFPCPAVSLDPLIPAAFVPAVVEEVAVPGPLETFNLPI